MLITIQIPVLNSIAMILFTATVSPSRCITDSYRKTKPWQTRMVVASIVTWFFSIHNPMPAIRETKPMSML
jgi:hypothetical protein